MPNKALADLQPIPSTVIALDTPKTAAEIVRVRKILNISQKTLALEMRITPSYLCDLELSRRDWNMELFKMAKDAMGRLSK